MPTNQSARRMIQTKFENSFSHWIACLRSAWRFVANKKKHFAANIVPTKRFPNNAVSLAHCSSDALALAQFHNIFLFCVFYCSLTPHIALFRSNFQHIRTLAFFSLIRCEICVHLFCDSFSNNKRCLISSTLLTLSRHSLLVMDSLVYSPKKTSYSFILSSFLFVADTSRDMNF